MINQTEAKDINFYQQRIKAVRRKIANHPDIRCTDAEHMNKVLDAAIKVVEGHHVNG